MERLFDSKRRQRRLPWNFKVLAGFEIFVKPRGRQAPGTHIEAEDFSQRSGNSLQKTNHYMR
jgi:hypothetical protein